MQDTNWSFEDRIKIIKNYKKLPTPQFNDGNEDAYRFNVWNLYDRIYEAIKSFVILYENQRYCDAFIIAGQALETCAILSYIKDYDDEDTRREHYNKYFASITLGRMIANLELAKNLEKDIAWVAFACVLRLFYPFGKCIIKEHKDYEKIIKKINYRKGPNSEKIGLLNKNFKPVSVSEYIQTLSDNWDNKDDGQFRRYYTKYCNMKHSNVLTPGLLKENIGEDTIDDMLYLVLGIMTYLDTSKPLF